MAFPGNVQRQIASSFLMVCRVKFLRSFFLTTHMVAMMKDVKMKIPDSSQDQTGSSTTREAVQATDILMRRVMKPVERLSKCESKSGNIIIGAAT